MSHSFYQHKEAAWAYTLRSVCELNNSWVETSHRLWKRSVIDDGSWNTSVIYMVICGAGSEICGYHNWNLTMLCVCGVMLFNSNSSMVESCKAMTSCAELKARYWSEPTWRILKFCLCFIYGKSASELLHAIYNDELKKVWEIVYFGTDRV